jgi:hypothetical protein
MEAVMANQNVPDSKPSESEGGCLSELIRWLWLFIGPAAIVFCAIYVAKGEASIIPEIIYVTLVVGLIVIRYIDIRVYKGTTANDKKATIKDWLRYTIILVLLSGLLYAIAKFLTRYELF